MAKYIDREALIAWLKRIPLKDLSDGRGLCRIIMEDDFKRAIKTIPKTAIADVAPVVRCKDCKHYRATDSPMSDGMCYLHTEPCANDKGYKGEAVCVEEYDFCSYGERGDA